MGNKTKLLSDSPSHEKVGGEPMPSKKSARKQYEMKKDDSDRAPSAPRKKTEMPSWMVSEIIDMVIARWRGTLEQYKEDSLRNSGLYDAVFCEHNEHIAALCVLKAHHVTVPEHEKTESIAMAKGLLNYRAV